MDDLEARRQFLAIRDRHPNRSISMLSNFLLNLFHEDRISLIRELLREIATDDAWEIVTHMMRRCLDSGQIFVARRITELAEDSLDCLFLLVSIAEHTRHFRDIDAVRKMCVRGSDAGAMVHVRQKLYMLTKRPEDLDELLTAIEASTDSELKTEVLCELLEEESSIDAIVTALTVAHDDETGTPDSTRRIALLITRVTEATIARRDARLILQVANEVPYPESREKLLELAIMVWHGQKTFGIN